MLTIEKLNKEILNLEQEKKVIIENTKSIIEQLKSDNNLLIYQIDKIAIDKEKIDSEKYDLMKKTEDFYKKSQENFLLKNEIEKTKNSFKREKSRYEISKGKEVAHLQDQIKFSAKFEKELTTVKTENAKLKNHIIDLNNEIKKLKTVKNKRKFNICFRKQKSIMVRSLNSSL
jgi:hypothetical protein